MRPGNGFLTARQSASSPVSLDNNQKTIEHPQLNKAISGSDSIQNSVGQQLKEASSENNGQNNTPKIQNEEKVISRQHSKKGITGDSLTEPSEKIMVVKKIIKRDTIFVEK